MPSNRPQQRRSSDRRPTAPTAGSRTPRAGGTRRPGPATPPTRPGLRASLEKLSYPILVRLTSAPKWLLGALTAALLIGGLVAPPPWGPILLGLVVLFLLWLLILAWPRLDTRARLVRAAVVVAMAALVVAQAGGWL